jgi:hypothetical protein
MLISEMNPDTLSHEEMSRMLFSHLKDDGQAGECIFVFGSHHAQSYRVPKAVALYNERRANKILFSGGTIWESQGACEAMLMKESAIQLGVPCHDILTETASQNTKENVLASLLVLDRAIRLHQVRRLLVVTTTYHMRRCLLTLKTYMPKWIEYTLCPADDEITKADNWWLSEKGTKRVIDESRKMIEYVKSGSLIDQEI